MKYINDIKEILSRYSKNLLENSYTRGNMVFLDDIRHNHHPIKVEELPEDANMDEYVPLYVSRDDRSLGIIPVCNLSYTIMVRHVKKYDESENNKYGQKHILHSDYKPLLRKHEEIELSYMDDVPMLCRDPHFDGYANFSDFVDHRTLTTHTYAGIEIIYNSNTKQYRDYKMDGLLKHRDASGYDRIVGNLFRKPTIPCTTDEHNKNSPISSLYIRVCGAGDYRYGSVAHLKFSILQDMMCAYNNEHRPYYPVHMVIHAIKEKDDKISVFPKAYRHQGHPQSDTRWFLSNKNGYVPERYDIPQSEQGTSTIPYNGVSQQYDYTIPIKMTSHMNVVLFVDIYDKHYKSFGFDYTTI